MSVNSADARSIYRCSAFGAIVVVSLYGTRFVVATLIPFVIEALWMTCRLFIVLSHQSVPRCFSLPPLSQDERQKPGVPSPKAHFPKTWQLPWYRLTQA